MYFFINKNVQQLIIDDWLLIVLLVNLLFTSNALSTLSWSLHLLLYTLFVNTLSLRLFTSSYFLIPLGASMIFQLVLATTQVTLGHSVDRLLYYLGERTIAVGQPAVALGTFMDSVVLRAYGTFSHPNTLAGWLVVSLLILIKIAPTKKLLIGNWLLIISTSATVAGVLLTQSRAAALALFGIVIPFYLIKTPKSKIMYFVLLVIPISYFLFPTLLSPSRSDLSFSERRTLQRVSLSVMRSLPIFGTGAQASISTYPAVAPNTRLLQPDHNSFTLFLSWFGVLGALAIIYTLRHLIPNFYFLIPLIPLLLLDHYFLTSPQGLFVILLYLRLVRLQRPSEQKTRHQRV